MFAQVVSGIKYKFVLEVENVQVTIVIQKKLDGSVEVVSNDIRPTFANIEKMFIEAYENAGIPQEENQ